MARRLSALVLTLGAIGCGGLGPSLTVKASDIPGTWTSAACGESMTLKNDGTGAIQGFPDG